MTPTLVRATPEGLTALAARIYTQPALARYGATPEGLARSLAAACARGDWLWLAHAEDQSALGLAWVMPDGMFGALPYLRLLCLVPGSEGQGVGGALLDAAEHAWAARRHLFLLVTAQNHGARRFYEARGYAALAPLPDLMRAGIDEVLLHKSLA